MEDKNTTEVKPEEQRCTGSALNDLLYGFLLKIDSMGGSGDYYNTVFADGEVAVMRAKSLESDFVNYNPEKTQIEPLDSERCIAGGRVYKLDRTTAQDEHRKCGLAKLTEKERNALGV